MDLTPKLQAFFEACELAARILEEETVAQRWRDASAVEGFTVGGIAGHLYAAIRRFEIALDEPLPDPVHVGKLAEFYGLNRVDGSADLNGGLHPLVRQDGERRAEYGPEAVARRFGELVARLEERLAAEPRDRLVPVWTIANGATTLEDYLTTRVVELVVHTDDLAASAELPPLVLPEAAAAVTIDVFIHMARARSGDLEVIRAFARRERAGSETLRVL